MTAAQETAASLYADNPRISAHDLAEACKRTPRWARGMLAKLSAAGSQGTTEPVAEPVPLSVPEPVVDVAEAAVEPAASITEAQPAGAKTVVWVAFATGILASVAANALSASGGIEARIAAAFAPVALLLSVEVIARTTWYRRGFWWALAKYAGVGAVAAVAFVVSYVHQRHLLLSFGESKLSATILPWAVDGLILVSATALVAMKGEKR